MSPVDLPQGIYKLMFTDIQTRCTIASSCESLSFKAVPVSQVVPLVDLSVGQRLRLVRIDGGQRLPFLGDNTFVERIPPVIK